MAASQDLDQFFNSFQTLPGLIRRLALSVAEAQTELDRNYVESLGEFSKLIANTLKNAKDKSAITADQYRTLFQAIAPSRYQFSETVVEMRADLQATSESSTQLSGQFGLKAGIFAVTVNASYAKRSGTDVRAAALVRTVLNAIPADTSLVDKFLARGGTTTTTLPAYKNRQFEALAEVVKELPAATESGGNAKEDSKPKPEGGETQPESGDETKPESGNGDETETNP